MSIKKENTGLSEEIIDKINHCFAQFPELDKVVLYGSRAKGNYRNGSDIDLCLFGDSVSTQTILKLENDLDDLMFPYSFDLSVYHLLDNANFVNHIDRVGKEFYKRL